MSNDELRVPPLSELFTHHSEKWRGFPQDVIPLPVAEMDFPVAAPIRELLQTMVAQSDLGYLGAIPELGTSFAGFAERHWSWSVDPLKVRAATDVGVGVVELLRVFTVPGDRILINSPVYQNFYNWIKETKVVGFDVPFIHHESEAQIGTSPSDSWQIDWPAVESAYRSGIKVHLLCNPHNPIGRVFSEDELNRLVALAVENNVIIISDEIHAPLEYKESPFTPVLALGHDAEKVAVVVTAASKGWNIAGLKCAIIISGSDEMHERLNALPYSLHFRASLLGAFATATAFEKCEPWLDAVITQLDHNRQLIAGLLGELLPNVKYVIPQHSYLAWLDFSGHKLGPEPATKILEKAKVALNPGHTYGAQWDQFARLNFATSPEIITDALTRIARGLDG
jgi:cystathionine beta-lyase